ncbi:MAG TPA: DUF6049 family protein [Streptosporangiaceae bacterium]|jgi:hypothetical protein
MPPPPPAQPRRPGRPVRLARALLAAAAAGGLAAAIPLAVPAAGAAAGSQAADTPPVSVVIDSISPGYARPGQTVTVTGTVTNASAASVSALTIQLTSSRSAFSNRDSLQDYATSTSTGPALAAVPGASTAIGSLAPKAMAPWSIRLPASKLRVSAFGVYPLAAQAENSVGATLDASRTFLPFWPGKRALDPVREQIAWVWPLVDQPRQSPCGGLTSSGLAASVSGDGRLAGLLEAAAAYTSRAHLTWAIDPALLSDADTMTRPYGVSGSKLCTSTAEPPSRAARDWLSELKSATARQPVFVTPYADVDDIALVRRGMNGDLARAFTEGREVAGQILHRDFSPAQASGGPATLRGMAWPPGGVADYPTLQSLAGVNGISAVVLDSATMLPLSSFPPTPSAQAVTPDGEGPDLRVLVSDHEITSILGAAGTSSAVPGGGLAARQLYLAQTAMIAAEAPDLGRSVVVAPPSRWDPSPRLARDLLASTVSAPWLRPVSAAALLSGRPAAGQVPRRLELPLGASSGMLGRTLLLHVHQLDRKAAVLQSIRPQPDTALSRAALATESSAWRGRGPAARTGRQLLRQVAGFVAAQQRKVTLLAQPRVTLGGLKGTVPVSIANHLGYPVKVRLRVSVPAGGSITVRSQRGLLTVPAGNVITIKLGVNTAAVSSTTLQLSLLTPGGTPLPGGPVAMTIQATHYGTLALVIIAAALGVFMLTSATKAVRRGRGGASRDDASRDGGPDGPGGSGGAGGAGGPAKDDPADARPADARPADARPAGSGAAGSGVAEPDQEHAGQEHAGQGYAGQGGSPARDQDASAKHGRGGHAPWPGAANPEAAQSEPAQHGTDVRTPWPGAAQPTGQPPAGQLSTGQPPAADPGATRPPAMPLPARRPRSAAGQPPPLPPDPDHPSQPSADQQQWPGSMPRPTARSGRADTVESGPANARAGAGADDLEDADEYARTPGRADRDAGWSRPG